MKKVLIAIDYNSCSQEIAETGFEYARSMNAEICIVHVIADIAHYPMEYSPVMGFEGFSPDSSFKNIEEQVNEANRFLEAVIKHLGDSNIKIMVLDGKTADAILHYAAEYGANLVVIGAHSHSSFEKLMGDVAAEMVHHAEIPILIVPPDKHDISQVNKKEDMFQYVF